MEKKEIDELRFKYCSRMNKAAQKDSKEHDQDKTTILTSLLEETGIKQTNGIYVCTGTYISLSTDCYVETWISHLEVPFDSKSAEYRWYKDIETKKSVKAFIRPSKGQLSTSEFEKKHIVLNPHNTSESDNGYEEVRHEFFMGCIEQGQEESKKLILSKYSRM